MALIDISTASATEELHIKNFGDPKKPAVIFIHGGPGYNCFMFEAAAAAKLSDQGLFVITYDQRGCGRSKIKNCKYTFSEAVDDLAAVYERSKIKKAALIGHSFGGAVAVKFAQSHPEMIDRIILVSAPLDYPAMFKSILANSKNKCEKFYPKGLEKIAEVEKMSASSLEYLSSCFITAMNCGLYIPSKPSADASALMARISKEKEFPLSGQSEFPPVEGFFKNEKYSTIDISNELSTVMKNIKVFGIYGDEDGLFDSGSLDKIKQVIGENNFRLVKNCSHNVFVDQNSLFIETVSGFVK